VFDYACGNRRGGGFAPAFTLVWWKSGRVLPECASRCGACGAELTTIHLPCQIAGVRDVHPQAF